MGAKLSQNYFYLFFTSINPFKYFLVQPFIVNQQFYPPKFFGKTFVLFYPSLNKLILNDSTYKKAHNWILQICLHLTGESNPHSLGNIFDFLEK